MCKRAGYWCFFGLQLLSFALAVGCRCSIEVGIPTRLFVNQRLRNTLNWSRITQLMSSRNATSCVCSSSVIGELSKAMKGSAKSAEHAVNFLVWQKLLGNVARSNRKRGTEECAGKPSGNCNEMRPKWGHIVRFQTSDRWSPTLRSDGAALAVLMSRSQAYVKTSYKARDSPYLSPTLLVRGPQDVRAAYGGGDSKESTVIFDLASCSWCNFTLFKIWGLGGLSLHCHGCNAVDLLHVEWALLCDVRNKSWSLHEPRPAY